MSTHTSGVSSILIEQVSIWLKTSALEGKELEKLVSGFCERLAAAGMPMSRIHLSFSVLHPLYDALGFTWGRGKGVKTVSFQLKKEHSLNERFLQSPYFYLLQNDLDHLRRRIDPLTPSEFPIFEDLKAEGVTDYLAFVQPFGEGVDQSMFGSWATDVPGGFSDDVIEALLKIQKSLAVAAKMSVLGKLADNMLLTYLGSSAGKRVRSGQIRRGDGETIRAALVMVDMRQSTVMAEREGRQAYIDTLNEFFDATATPFTHNGGEILSFIGDGFLAIYPCSRHREPSIQAAKAAMAAVRKAKARMVDLNVERRARGEAEIRFGMGLHVGNVMFGNVGLRDRLTFSVFGAAVNQVQRLQELAKTDGAPIVASQIFANYSGGEWDSLGERTLRGFPQKVPVFQPGDSNLVMAPTDAADAAMADGLSEAEQIMLLYKTARKNRPSEVKTTH